MNLISKGNRNALGAKLAAMSVGASVMMSNAMVAFATDGNTFGNAQTTITNLFNELETALKGIVVPIAACALIFCFIMTLVSTNQKKVESYRSWAITIFFCIIGIYAVPFLIQLAQNIGASLAGTGPT